jgi:hypothetical protein
MRNFFKKLGSAFIGIGLILALYSSFGDIIVEIVPALAVISGMFSYIGWGLMLLGALLNGGLEGLFTFLGLALAAFIVSLVFNYLIGTFLPVLLPFAGIIAWVLTILIFSFALKRK